MPARNPNAVRSRSTRQSITLTKPEIETQEELRAVVGDIARDMIIARTTRNAMEAELAAVRAKYEAELVPLDQQIETATELVADYATQHPDLFPGKVRSLDLVTAVIGFRTGQPKVKTLKRWTPSAVFAAIKERRWPFLRTVEELDKEGIIAARATFDNDTLKLVGLAVVQDERFYVEPKDLTPQPTQAVTER
jgi:phage host-nuclease inhibitor protein Gam